MLGLILAGGEGTRLAADGIGTPKPLVPVAGRPQVVGLLAALRAAGCTSVLVQVRQDYAEEVRRAIGSSPRGEIRVESCLTPSSLHTLAAGLAALPPGEVLCTMVDTVMPLAEWSRVGGAVERGLRAGRQIMLAVTGYVDDESPLWVRRDAAGDVTWLGQDPVSPACVTGGVYGLSPAARELVPRALAGGLERMRHFLTWAVEQGTPVGTIEVPRIIDLDRRRDLEQATTWLQATPGGGVHP